MTAPVGTWDHEGEKTICFAEVIAVGARSTDERPDGAIQMQWTDDTGFVHQAHLVHWWRLDRQGLRDGVTLDVYVQARQRRDLSCPPHHVNATLRVTGDPDDHAQVMIGDPDRIGSWSYGVRFQGAVLTSTSASLA